MPTGGAGSTGKWPLTGFLAGVSPDQTWGTTPTDINGHKAVKQSVTTGTQNAEPRWSVRGPCANARPSALCHCFCAVFPGTGTGTWEGRGRGRGRGRGKGGRARRGKNPSQVVTVTGDWLRRTRADRWLVAIYKTENRRDGDSCRCLLLPSAQRNYGFTSPSLAVCRVWARSWA